MLKKRLKLLTPLLLLAASAITISNVAEGKRNNSTGKSMQREMQLRAMEDSLLMQVKKEDLLDDEVYQKLAYEGWTPPEIIKIMSSALTDKNAARNKVGYEKYAKRWLPDYGLLPGNDSLYLVVDSALTEETRRNVLRAVPEDEFNKDWAPKTYMPPLERFKKAMAAGDDNPEIRDLGYFRQPKFKPSVGRMSSITINPKNEDELYVSPDGAGIYHTADLGKHWECITDHIPDRYDRLRGGYGIPVDPDDFNHVFCFTSTGKIYESTNGGKSWEIVPGGVNKSFKRVFAIKNKAGELKFIGCTRGNPIWTTSTLWISEDKGVTWDAVTLPEELKDTHAYTGQRGTWFQEVLQDPSNRDMILMPTPRSIFYFDDGAKSTMVGGRKEYNLQKLPVVVYADDAKTIRRYPYHKDDMGKDDENAKNYYFPCPSTQPGNLLINPNPDRSNEWWFATGCQGEFGLNRAGAIFFSDDHGKTWVTRNDPLFGIGTTGAFGHTLPDSWLGGFAVNFADPHETAHVYGCNTTAAQSADGGRNFAGFGWLVACNAEDENGNWIANSFSRHNSDNHYMASHPSGRVFRASDGGMLCVDPNKNNHAWFEIGGDMGQMLFYNVAVNEFGDQCMFGNTQDTDGQTYRYGRWGRWRGYEGSESWVNPYSGSNYVSDGGLCGFDPDYMSLSSWNNAWTKADVVTGSWFFTRSGGGAFNGTFQRCDDLGQRTVNLQEKLGESVAVFGKFGLCRDKGRSTVYVITASNALKRSIDGGDTFDYVRYNGQPARFSNTVIATDPNNSDIVYLGQTGKVMRLYVDNDKFEEVGKGLPEVSCTQLMFHEGSGDLYFYHNGSGFYILEYDKTTGRYAENWRYWTTGYNISKSRAAVINYTTQEMVLCDFGTGVWCADLQHPSDRFFSDGFKLKEFSFKDGRHTIGIDTEWTIPLYYYFKWYVNGALVEDNPYQYLRRRLNPGDKVKLELTLRESPDVHTMSEEFVVPTTGTAGADPETHSAPAAEGAPMRTGESGGVSYDNPVVKESGRAVSSNGEGRIDLGYFDYFFNDFTIDFWIKPFGDGSIISNTSRSSGQPKGFDLYIQGGRVKFTYYPQNVFMQPRYEAGITQTATVQGNITYNVWHHVALTHKRYDNGKITIYVDGVKSGEGVRILPEATLNNSMVLSLFADAIEREPISTCLDELKIWTKELTQDEVRREMFSTNCDGEDGLAAYWSFNGGSLNNETEEFSRHGMKPRTRGGVRYLEMTVPTCASVAVNSNVAANTSSFTFKKETKGVEKNILALNAGVANANISGNYGVYLYDSNQWNNEEDNLDSDFFVYEPVGYMIHSFDKKSKDTQISLDFYPYEGKFEASKPYNFFVTDPNLDKQVWERVGKVEYNTEKGTVKVTGLTLGDILDKKLLLVTTLPGVQVTVEGMDEKGVLPVYDTARTTYPISALLLDNFPAPSEKYNFTANGILQGGSLQFTDGLAQGTITLDMSKLSDFNSKVRTTIRSRNNMVKEDGKVDRMSLIPLTIDVRNRLTPTSIGTGLYLDKACATIGSYDDFKSLLGATDITIMGWVRIDDPAILTATNYGLMTFRDQNNNVNGVVLDNGKIVLVWDGAKLTASTYAITEEDLGNWVHIAVIKRTDIAKRVEYYKNGIYYGYARGIAPITKGVGPFCLGKNSKPGTTSNADNFSGAFDQVAVWTRGIAQDEVFKYMYSAPPLNDNGLLLFANMDYTDRDGVHRDCFSDAEIKLVPTTNLGGSATFDEEPHMPYESRLQTQWNDTQAVVSLEYPGAKQSRFAVVNTFRGTPHNYYFDGIKDYIPLSKEYYTITFLQAHNASYFGDQAVIVYRNPIIRENDKLAVGMRRVGAAEHLSGFVEGTATTDGEIRFEVPSTYMANSTEVMFFMFPSEGDPTGGRLSRAELSFAPSIADKLKYTEGDDVPVLELEHGNNEIPITVNYINIGRYTDNIAVSLKDNDNNDDSSASFAKIAEKDASAIDLSQPTNNLTVEIDRDKTNRFGMNYLRIDMDNVHTEKPLRLKFYYRPYVKISLDKDEQSSVIPPDDSESPSTDPKDPDVIPDAPEEGTPSSAPARGRADEDSDNITNVDIEGHTITARTPVPSFKLSAELIEGYLPDGMEVEYEISGDMPASLQIGNGSLLQNQAVEIEKLEYYESYLSSPSYYEGWNLVGNPYLTNINITSSRNVDYEPTRLTKFAYHCNPATGNYEVHDMTRFDVERVIAPFQSFFVQTMSSGTSITVKPEAKEETPSKHTLATTYSAEEKKQLTLALYSDGKEYDRVTIAMDPDAKDGFNASEDAAKLWNLTGSSPELFATADGKSVAVSTVNSDTTNDVVLGLKAPEAGEMTLKVVDLQGFDEEDHPTVIDTSNNNYEWNVYKEPEYKFNANAKSAGDSAENGETESNRVDDPSRFLVQMSTPVLTGIDTVKAEGYKIEVEGNLCTIYGLKGDAMIAIYTVNGMRVDRAETSSDTYTIHLAEGIYIVNILENGKEYTSKITIR